MSIRAPHSSRLADWLRTLRPMAERAAFILYLGMAVGACGGLGLGLIVAFALRDPRLLLAGLGALLLAGLLKWHGYRVWSFARWEESIQPSDRRRVMELEGEAEGRAAELEGVLNELDALGQVQAGRDVWRIQELRQEAHELLNGQPALRQEFAHELERHPELR